LPGPDIRHAGTGHIGGYLIAVPVGYASERAPATSGADPAWLGGVTHVVLIFVVAVAGWLFPPTALAQSPDGSAPEGRYLLGSSVSVTPAIAIVAGRDSNAIRTNTGVPAGELYVVPQIESWIGRGRVRLNLANAVELSKQQTSGSGDPNDPDTVSVNKVNTLNQYHLARLDVGGPRLSLQGIAGFRNHYAPPTDFVGFELGLKSRRLETELGTVATVRPGGRIFFRGLVNASRLRYDADFRFQGASLEQNLNRNITLFGGEAQVQLTPLSSAGVSVNYYRDRFLFASDRDGNGLRVMAGGQFSPRALIAGRVEAGYLRYRTVETNQEYGGPAYNVGLSLTKSPVFLDVSGRRSIEYSFDPGRGFYVSNGIDAFSTVTLGTAWEAFGRASVRGMSPKGLLAQDEPFRAIELYKAGLARRFGAMSKIGTDIERYKTGGPGGFQGVRWTVFMIYGTTRLQRLDRPLPGGF
jgi:hypothetical protein